MKIKLNTFILIDKPKGWTSFDVVAKIRRLASQQSGVKKIRVGHAGTLDPFATGLLIVGVGREATKRLDGFKAQKKVYVAELTLGQVSDTYDSAGVISDVNLEEKPNKSQIKEALYGFLGQQKQIPPMFSAKKINGKRLYELARQGKEVERKPSDIEIYNIKLKRYKYPRLVIKVECSTGTYVRSLVNDIGQKLGVGAYCQELRRTRIGKHGVWRAGKIG
jgi:tRNA pseudouridine55 synthase